MKKLFLDLVLVSLVALIFGVNSKLPANGSVQTIKKGLILTTSIVDKEYSKGDNDLYAVRIKLELRFTNKTPKAVLIEKAPFPISHIWVSESEEKAFANDFEQDSTQSFLVSDAKPVDKLTSSDFIALSKGESFNTEEEVVLFVPYDSEKKIDGSISRGSHVLQILVNLSTRDERDTQFLSKRFSRQGILWTKSVRSKPMKFCIGDIRDCRKK